MEPIRKIVHNVTPIVFLNLILQLLVLAVAIIIIYPINELKLNLYGETRLLAIVGLGGILGSSIRYSGLVNSAASWKNNQRTIFDLYRRLLSGIPLAAIGYLIIRGILLNSNISYQVFNIYGVMIFSVVAGFFSYESLNKFTVALQRLLERDSVIEDKIEKISGVLGIDVLGNYHGHLYWSITWNEIFQEERTVINAPSFVFQITCRFVPGNQHYYHGALNRSEIEISGGKDVEHVTFSLVPRISGFKFTPSTVNVIAYHQQPSDEVRFSVTLPSPAFPDCWIEISQKNRLVAVVSPALNDQNATG